MHVSLFSFKRLGLFLCIAFLSVQSARAQLDQSEMLAQIAKLEIFLSQAEKGYQIAKEGLNTIGEIKQGDFNLHQLFFNSLQLVNPAIRSYIKIADIIAMQTEMLSAYKQSYAQSQSSGLFSPAELSYIYSVYTGILSSTAADVNELTGVITDGDWQMDDAQRLGSIDRLYVSVSAKYQSLTTFGNRLQIQLLQKQNTSQGLQTLSKLVQP